MSRLKPLRLAAGGLLQNPDDLLFGELGSFQGSPRVRTGREGSSQSVFVFGGLTKGKCGRVRRGGAWGPVAGKARGKQRLRLLNLATHCPPPERNVLREVNTMRKLALLFGLLGILAVVLTGCS